MLFNPRILIHGEATVRMFWFRKENSWDLNLSILFWFSLYEFDHLCCGPRCLSILEWECRNHWKWFHPWRMGQKMGGGKLRRRKTRNWAYQNYQLQSIFRQIPFADGCVHTGLLGFMRILSMVASTSSVFYMGSVLKTWTFGLDTGAFRL